MDNLTTAGAFFEACDYGKGWTGCRSYCHENASFETEAETLAEINTLDTYCDWMVEALAMFDKTVQVEVGHTWSHKFSNHRLLRNGQIHICFS